MGIGVSVFLIAIGAILSFAIEVKDNNSGIDINTIGVILMAVGAIGLIISVFMISSLSGRRDGGVVVEERDVIR